LKEREEAPQGKLKMQTATQPILQVQDLQTYLYTERGVVKAVDGVSIHVNKGEIFGLVGESGSGKTMTALSIMRLVPSPPGRIVSGQIILDGADIISLREKEMLAIRGKKVSMVFQDPLVSLNPIMRVGDQISETVKFQMHLDKSQAQTRTIELLQSVGIPEAQVRARQYPFEMSGGMRQRIMIALALSCSPTLLIADEPTTNLDVTIQAQILELLRKITREFNTSIMLITHSMGIVAWLCDRVGVMYAGKIVEQGKTKDVFRNPMHPYTQALLKAIPKTADSSESLYSIQGDVPNMITVPSGCRFNPRCEFAKEICRSREPQLVEIERDHFVRCLMYETDGWGRSKKNVN
jgi:peptide/nickel transport system ATP-binding protein